MTCIGSVDDRAVWNVDKRAILESCGIERVERPRTPRSASCPRYALNDLALGCQIADRSLAASEPARTPWPAIPAPVTDPAVMAIDDNESKGRVAVEQTGELLLGDRRRPVRAAELSRWRSARCW